MRNKVTARNYRSEGTMVASNLELEWMKAKVLRFSEIRRKMALSRITSRRSCGRRRSLRSP